MMNNMNYTIYIDGDVMRDMSVLVKKANAEIQDACAQMRSVEEHKDWQCREKVNINENLAVIRKYSTELSEDADYFANAVVRVAEEFEKKQKELQDKFQYLEAKLGKVLAVPFSNGSSTNIGSSTEGAVSSVLSDNNGWWKSVSEPINNWDISSIGNDK